MPDDFIAKLEKDVQEEQTPHVTHLLRLFAFGFSKTKAISCIYLSAFILLSLLRPLLAVLWGRYIQTVEALQPEQEVLPAILLLAGYFLINFLADLISRYVYLLDDMEQLNLVQANRQQEKLHAVLYEKLAAIPPEDMEISAINDRIQMVFQFVSGRNNGMNTGVMLQGYSIVAKSVSVFTIAASLYLFSPWLCLLVLLSPLPTIWVNTAGQKLQFRFRKNNVKLLRRADYFQKLMISSASGKELKILGLHDFIYDKWKKAIDEYTQKEKQLIQTKAKFLMLHNFIVNVTIVLSSVFAILLMTFGKLSLGGLGAVLSLITTLVGDVRELLTGIATFLTKKNEAAQLFDFLELPEQSKTGVVCEEPTVIKAQNLKYRYPLTDRYVLDGVNLTIKKGERVAFVGENGMGKTTFVKLLTGILSPSAGSLQINGVDVREIEAESRYERMSVVMQEPSRYVTFHIGDNVFLGDTSKERTEREIDEALSFAGLETPDKNTLLGKDVGGAELSGGQWQKLAIARAVYRGKNFIVLDEPTSNLDPLAETEIFRKYMLLAADKTVVFVTHRISVAALADRIIVFDKGRIVEDGTHEQLLAQNGTYAHLYQEQAKWYDR